MANLVRQLRILSRPLTAASPVSPAFTAARVSLSANTQRASFHDHAAFRPTRSLAFQYTGSRKMAESVPKGTADGHPIVVATADLLPKLPSHSTLLFAAKKAHNLSFATIGAALQRDEVAAAALFYGQARASDADITALSQLLHISEDALRATDIASIPDRGRSLEMPPREPLMYRLYEIVQNYGYAYKAVINEKFGDGIMSAISYSTKVEKEVDEKGEWVKITLRGKWLPYTRF